MDRHHPPSFHLESSKTAAREMLWAALLPPLAVTMIIAMVGFLCLWLDVLI